MSKPKLTGLRYINDVKRAIQAARPADTRSVEFTKWFGDQGRICRAEIDYCDGYKDRAMNEAEELADDYGLPAD